MPGFVKLARLDQIEDGSAVEVECGGRVYALFRLGDRVLAVDGVCPHQGGPLADGDLDGVVVTCPWHGWKFNLETGEMPGRSKCRVETFEARVEGGDVLVNVP